MNWKGAVAAGVAVVLLSACDPPRKCVDWDTQWVPVTTQHCVSTSNGKTSTVHCFPTTTIQPVRVCVKWEEPAPTPTPSREPQ